MSFPESPIPSSDGAHKRKAITEGDWSVPLTDTVHSNKILDGTAIITCFGDET